MSNLMRTAPTQTSNQFVTIVYVTTLHASFSDIYFNLVSTQGSNMFAPDTGSSCIYYHLLNHNQF